MAKRTKKETALTPEEKLQQALVSVEEQPYPVPANWCWVVLGNLVSIKRGASPRPIKSYITEDSCGVNWIKIGDTDEGKYVDSVKEKITEAGATKSVFVEKGTLLLSNSMSFGRPYILNVDGCIHDGWLAITPGKSFEKEYLYYALLSSKWYFERVAVGTAVRNLNSDRVALTPVPLPSLPEQYRIVARIESLFAKLDEVKEKAQAVVDGYEDRKAAILHKAFTGELTAKWRKKNGITLDSWKEYSFEKCIKMMQNGLSKRTGSVGTPFAVLRLANFVDEEIIADDIREIRLDNRECEKYELYENDVLMIRVNGSKENVGKQFIVPNQTKWAFCDHIIRIRYIDELLPQYMLFFARSEKYKTYVMDNMVSSAGQNTISRKGMANLTVSIPSVEEQQQIVDLLKDLLAQQQQVKSAAESVLNQIDTMKKSILARAFRGELGTNDPSDEPAIELLKRVLQEE